MDPKSRSSIYSLPLLCLGLGAVAICVLVPAADSNKRLTADRDKLQRDLTQIEAQVTANQEFLANAKTDPEIAERLAQRQLKQIRAGTTVLELKGLDQKVGSSPFEMVSVPPQRPIQPYRPLGGVLGEICRDARQQMYAVGMGMFMIATALVLGASQERRSSENSGMALPTGQDQN
jgi:hypothetical protein